MNMQMDINAEERKYLQSALDHYIAELGTEIRNTDNRDYRTDLRHEKEILSVLMEKLGSE